MTQSYDPNGVFSSFHLGEPERTFVGREILEDARDRMRDKFLETNDEVYSIIKMLIDLHIEMRLRG